MQIANIRRVLQKRSFLVLSAGVISFAILFVVMRLWTADFRYAFSGGSGDCALEMMAIRNMIETGTRNFSDRLGGIGGQSLYNYPNADALNYGIMYIISLFTNNAAVIMNVFYILTFPLAAMSAMWVFLEIGVSSKVSMIASIIFPLMPYHFLRNENHLLLSAYYMVPFGILIAFWILQNEITVSFKKNESIRKAIYVNRKFLLSVLFCLMISSTGLYYAYFTCFFICMAIVKQTFAARRWNTGSSTGVGLLIVIMLGVLMNYLPTLIYHLSGGERATELLRPRESASYYGLKLIDLFVPSPLARIDFIRDLVGKFHAVEPLSNENITVSLGLFASVGFAFLLILPVISFAKNTIRIRLLKNASYFAYSGFLLATIGGVSAIISWLLFSSIRAYNRISVFLFFLALLSSALILDAIIYGDRKDHEKEQIDEDKAHDAHYSILKNTFRKSRKHLAWFLLPILFVALFDLIPYNSVIPYAYNKQVDQEVEEYFEKVEESVPAGTAVFQLPYVSFPEPTISYGNGPYAQLAGYLNTDTLRWSYGAMLGTQADTWVKYVWDIPAQDMLKEIKKAGYGAIYIDLLNYPEDRKANLDELIRLTEDSHIISEDGQRIFINLIT